MCLKLVDNHLEFCYIIIIYFIVIKLVILQINQERIDLWMTKTNCYLKMLITLQLCLKKSAMIIQKL